MCRDLLYRQLLYLGHRLCKLCKSPNQFFYSLTYTAIVLRCLPRLLSQRELLPWFPATRLCIHRRPELRHRHALRTNRYHSGETIHPAEPYAAWCCHSGRRLCICLLRDAYLAPLPDARCNGRYRRGIHLHPQRPVAVAVVSKKRSLANGISAAGSGVGGIIFSLATGPLIQGIGHHWSLRVIGIIALGTNVVAAVLIRDRNATIRPVQLAIDRELLYRLDVGLLLAWAFLSMLGYITLLFSLSDYAFSIGLNQSQAEQITAFLNLGTACGRPFLGMLSDRLGRIEVAGTATLICGILVLLIWLPASSFGVVVLFAIPVGAILGVYWVVRISTLVSLSKQTVSPDHRSAVRGNRKAPGATIAPVAFLAVDRASNIRRVASKDSILC